MLIDPNEALLRPPPRDERDLVIAGSNGRVVALENLSVIQPVAVRRALPRSRPARASRPASCTRDADETLFSVQLPIVLNGIVEVVIVRRPAGPLDRADAADDRGVRVRGRPLGRVRARAPEDPRRAARRGRRRDGERARTVELAELPRMADFARWTAAAAPRSAGMPTSCSRRLRATTARRRTRPPSTPRRWSRRCAGWATSRARPPSCLSELVEIVGEGAAAGEGVAEVAERAVGALRRLAPNLRRANPPLEIEFDRDRAHAAAG